MGTELRRKMFDQSRGRQILMCYSCSEVALTSFKTPSQYILAFELVLVTYHNALSLI